MALPPPTRYQKVAYACGALLLAAGAFHFIVFLIKGGPWEGPISWRKPVLFGFSFGITVVTLTWVMSFLKLKPLSGWIAAGVMSVSALLEVFLVSMQKWRGVESHFNDKTTFDSSVFGIMGLMVGVMIFVIVYLTVRAFIRLEAPPSLALGIRLGFLILLLSQATGIMMIAVYGNVWGDAGAMKTPHALTMHGIQVLPALAVLLGRADTTEERRVRLVRMAAMGYAALAAATLIQTYSGRATFDVLPVSVPIAVLGFTLLGAVGLLALLGLRPARNGRQVNPT
ncbi:MAG TPA: hypothetical protein VNP73_05820 [Actinomycetota bacterium]|nr:hypothetical protein [Actinomycetota bacterium]